MTDIHKLTKYDKYRFGKNRKISDEEKKALARFIDCGVMLNFNRADMVVQIAVNWGKTPRTIERYYAEANEVKQKIASVKQDRITSALWFFRSLLSQWLYGYAFELTGEFRSRKFMILGGEEFQTDIKELNNIFIGKSPRMLNCKHKNHSKDEMIFSHVIHVPLLFNCLKRGKEIADLIDEKLKEYPTLFENAVNQVGSIVHIPNLIRSHFNEVDDVMKKGITEFNTSSEVQLTYHLRKLGSRILEVLLELDKEMKYLKSLEK